MFDPNYFSFIVDVTTIRRSRHTPGTFVIASPIKLRLAFFFNTVVRLRNHMRKGFWTNQVHAKLTEDLSGSVEAAAWFLKELSSRSYWLNILILCTHSGSRRQAKELILRAMACVLGDCRKHMNSGSDDSTSDSEVRVPYDLNVFEFMDQILRLLPRCFERPYSSDDFDYEEYFDLLRVFCQFGPNALSHLLNRRCVEKFIATFRGGFSITKMTDDEDSYDFDEISDMYKKKEYPWMKHVLRVLSVLITSSEDKVKMEVKAKRVSSEVQLDIAGSGCDGENDDYLGIADSHWELSPEVSEFV